ncbi:SO2930 family diheme c-type cytochrome [Sphingorhabdus lacus]|uniref:SO2930 family diheme c-type cytochrome n=1 Tax=Sphingorhabdus lacus TaxID=392610 RepID=UPI0035930604
MRLLLPFMACFAAAVGLATPHGQVSDQQIAGTNYPATLSAYGFFDGAANRPSRQLIPYQLRTPLFSDYAEKQRFIYLPEGARLTSDQAGKFEFPVGAALIKSFGYPDKSGALRILETRVLLHQQDGWVALPYIWRDDGGDADLRVGGKRMAVDVELQGTPTTISYAVPNKNQCKQCHSSDASIVPIGPIWQNMEFPRQGDREKLLQWMPQLAKMAAWGKWDDLEGGTLNERARHYLKVNCGHCHAPKGSASNSGLFLDGSAGDAAAYGIGKRPVAAGRASGDFDFVIEAGRPDRSILIYRMKSTDPGIAMPELGRATAHAEGVKLLEDWVAAMPSGGH